MEVRSRSIVPPTKNDLGGILVYWEELIQSIQPMKNGGECFLRIWISLSSLIRILKTTRDGVDLKMEVIVTTIVKLFEGLF